jgi:hypothetical protein
MTESMTSRLISQLVRAGTALLLLVLVAACDSTDPSDDPGAGEQEVISDVTLTLAPDDGSAAVTANAVFNENGELDDQTADLTLTLTPGVTYAGTIAFTNRFASDPDEQDISAEVRAEATEHQVFYVPLGDLASVLQVGYADDEATYSDEAEDPSEVRSGVPVGLAFTLTTTDNASSTNGELRVVLGHYDERPKSASERVDDVPERDVDVTFQVSIP